MARSLYITYDGLMEPLGKSQVVPYLRGLTGNHTVTVLSFEKPKDLADNDRRKALQHQLSQAGIEWIPLRYHKRLSVLATAFDIAHGALWGIGFAIRNKPRIVHVRGYVPGVIGLALKKLNRTRLIFDMRGFWPDEKVDAGAWRLDSRVYRVAKWFEKKLLQQADVVVSLTRAGVKEMRKFPYLRGRDVRFEVIPTCTDLDLFRPAERRNGHERRAFVLGYVGSVGTFYLFDEVLECFKDLLRERPEAQLLIVNRGAHEYVEERIHALGIPRDRVELQSAEYREVPRYIHQMDATAFFIKPTFSKKSSAPTRLGEFLACGVPCLVNAGVGDMDAIISSDRVGVVMQEFSPETRSEAIRELLALCVDEELRGRAIQTAHRHFSLEQGVDAYRKLYEDLAGHEISAGTRIVSRI